MKKVALALGSGGARGIAHIGAIEVLLENNIPIDFVCGSSMGGIIGGLFCAECDFEVVKSVIDELSLLDIVDIGIISKSRLGIVKGNKVVKCLEPLIGDKLIEESKIPFSCTAVDIKSGKTIVISKGKMIDALRATSAIPVIFRPVVLDEMVLIDGGVLNRVPSNEARDMGADIVIAIDVLGEIESCENITSVVGYINRVFDMMNWETAKYHVDDADIYLIPKQDTVKSISLKNIQDSYLAGRKVVLENIDKIKELVFSE